MALNYSGDFLATASQYGTKVKIFYAVTGEQLQELRRGIKCALIHQITFHVSSLFLACVSNREAIHIFELFDANDKLRAVSITDYTKQIPADEHGYEDNNLTLDSAVKNRTATLASLSSVLPSYFKSRWSFARIKLEDERKTCAFADGNNFVVVCKGSVSLYEIPRGGGYGVLKKVDEIEMEPCGFYDL
eukprot:TRINITY_DN8420_c0_g2_i1.p1 TRINITY_DN8420_c0_g2~~TRINITY_DN8420_c0_g2_i1.p1  ORF type:complete len:189 (+),score=41.01 TRINITY_DN8420_c0_g2_i1:709-1275(+)